MTKKSNLTSDQQYQHSKAKEAIMLRKVIVPFLFSICLSSFVLAAPFLYVGETNDGGVISEVWMDENIQPVGYRAIHDKVETI